jgi:hypothetical protein
MFELGPEPTAMGANPLISFGDTSPLTALVGEQQQHRAPAAHAPAPQATFLPETKPPFYKDRRVQIAAAVVVVLIVVLVVALS